jgi:hypothetical protein
MFLVPASILIVAIGIAPTEWLKVGISVIGAVIGALWCYRVWVWSELAQPDFVMAFGLGLIFGIAAVVSTIVHSYRAISAK